MTDSRNQANLTPVWAATKSMHTGSLATSSNPSDPDVYHDHDDCPTGQQIPARNRVASTGGYRRCQQCVALG